MASILIIGTGTIGEPLIGLFCTHAKDFGIDEIIFHKRTPLRTDRSKVLSLLKRGAKLTVDAYKQASFKELGIKPTYVLWEAMLKADVIIDCTPCGNKNKNEWYSLYEKTTQGFIAQGSEAGFGKPYAYGINDRALKNDKYIHIVSCNTHNLAAILQVAAYTNGLEDIESSRFICIRRANDISQTAKFMPSPTVGDHEDIEFGTHHARDVYHLFKTIDVDMKPIFSSAIKLNTQYMHTIHFAIKLKTPIRKSDIKIGIESNKRMALTWKKSANEVFSFGRDHGHYGRILNQAVFCWPSMHVSKDGREITGFCFTPQDGNSLVSSVAGALWLLDKDSYENKLGVFDRYYFNEI